MASLTKSIVREIVKRLVPGIVQRLIRNTITRVAAAIAGGIALAFSQFNNALGIGGGALTSPFGSFGNGIIHWIDGVNSWLVAFVGANGAVAPLVIVLAWAFAVVLTGYSIRLLLGVIKWI